MREFRVRFRVRGLWLWLVLTLTQTITNRRRAILTNQRRESQTYPTKKNMDQIFMEYTEDRGLHWPKTSWNGTVNIIKCLWNQILVWHEIDQLKQHCSDHGSPHPHLRQCSKHTQRTLVGQSVFSFVWTVSHYAHCSLLYKMQCCEMLFKCCCGKCIININECSYIIPLYIDFR